MRWMRVKNRLTSPAVHDIIRKVTKLRRPSAAGESRLFYLTPGQYTLRILNPMIKNSYVIDVRSQMTVNVQGKGLKMLVNVG